MNQRTLLGRLLSPAGFGLVLIFFLLPFTTVSCGSATEKAEATFTGLDMAIGGVPTVTSPDKDAGSARELGQLVLAESDLEPLALLAAVTVLAGMAVGLLRSRRVRHGAAAAAAVAAVALAVAAIMRVPGHVDRFLANVSGAEGLPAGMTTSNTIRYGFWLALITLVGLAAGNGFALLRAQRADDQRSATSSLSSSSSSSGPDEPDEPERLPLDELT
jgi:hypothetical protein